MNLLMLSGDASPAQGQESAFYHMLRRFSAHWEHVDVICPGAPGASSRTIHGSVHFHPSPWPKLLQPLWIQREGQALMAERQIDLVTSHDFGVFYNGLGAWLLTRGVRVPVVSEIHHVEGYPRAVARRERLYRALAKRYIPWAARWVAAFRVVNAVEMPGLLQRVGVPGEKIRVLPALYLDFEVFRPQPGEEQEFDVLFVGRLAPNKGLFTLLEALAQVQPTHPSVRLGMLGSGPLRAALEARIAARGLAANVTFIPRQAGPADVARLYRRSKMLVCASTAEGGPRVTVEAMACGTPVISTPVGVMPELVHDGENGLLFEWDAAELAVQIRRLLDNAALRQRLGEAGRAAVQHFEAQHVIDAYARGLQDVARQWANAASA